MDNEDGPGCGAAAGGERVFSTRRKWKVLHLMHNANCLAIKVVFPPLQEIILQHKLHFASALSLSLVKWSQTVDLFAPSLVLLLIPVCLQYHSKTLVDTLQWLDWLDLNAVTRLEGHTIMLQETQCGIDKPKRYWFSGFKKSGTGSLIEPGFDPHPYTRIPLNVLFWNQIPVRCTRTYMPKRRVPDT